MVISDVAAYCVCVRVVFSVGRYVDWPAASSIEASTLIIFLFHEDFCNYVGYL